MGDFRLSKSSYVADALYTNYHELISQHAQFKYPKTEKPNLFADIIHIIFHTCFFPAVTCQNVLGGSPTGTFTNDPAR